MKYVGRDIHTKEYPERLCAIVWNHTDTTEDHKGFCVFWSFEISYLCLCSVIFVIIFRFGICYLRNIYLGNGCIFNCDDKSWLSVQIPFVIYFY